MSETKPRRRAMRKMPRIYLCRMWQFKPYAVTLINGERRCQRRWIGPLVILTKRHVPVESP